MIIRIINYIIVIIYSDNNISNKTDNNYKIIKW